MIMMGAKVSMSAIEYGNNMIINIQGDIFDTEADAIINQCNCFHTMGGGIAKAISTKYPEAYKADLQTKYADYGKLGTFSIAQGSDGKFIYNMYSQFYFGSMGSLPGDRQTNYEFFYSGLHFIKADAKKVRGLGSLAIPHGIGCGLARGSWNIIHEMIKDLFQDDEITLYIHKI